MKQIKYPPRGSKEFNAIIGKYKYLFVADLPNMECRWAAWKANNGAASITETVEDLLVADTDVIADVYDRFVRLGIPSINVNALGKKERSVAYFFSRSNTLFELTGSSSAVGSSKTRTRGFKAKIAATATFCF